MGSDAVGIALFFFIFIFPIFFILLRRRFKTFAMITIRAFGAITLLSGVGMLAFGIYIFFFNHKEIDGSKWQIVLFIPWPIAFIGFGWYWLTDSGPGLEKQKIDFNSPELVNSITRARDTLPYFIREVRGHVDGAYIKFPFITDTNETEHVWGYVHHYEKGVFNVSMVNNPYTQKGDYDARRDVPERDVRDWMIGQEDGRIKGAYSYIGGFEYLARKGVRFNRTLRKQLARYIDAPPILTK